MIIFLRTHLLAKQLATNTVPELHKFLYLALPLFSEAIPPYISGHSKELSAEISAIGYIRLAIYILGLILLYVINLKGDYQSFLERFICLSFPAYVKVNTLGFFFGLLALPLWVKFDLELESFDIFDDLFHLVMSLLFYFLVGFWIRKVSTKSI